MNTTSNPQALVGKPRGRLPISPQGWPFLTGGAVLLFIAWLICWTTLAWILLILFVFMLNFFRDPKREPECDSTESAGLFISPADGKVIRAEQTQNGVRIDIFMNVFNVHVNRAPMAGRITHMDYTQGSFINAAHADAGEHNERNRFVMQTDAGPVVTFTQIAGLVARRIISYVGVGDHVASGQRIGMIRFGSRVNCEIPEGFKLRVSKGDKVKAGESILATLDKDGTAR